MKTPLKSLVQRIRNSSRSQACGLTIIGVGMLISTGGAEHIEHAALREVAQILVIILGGLATALLFCSSGKDRHSDTGRQDAE